MRSELESAAASSTACPAMNGEHGGMLRAALSGHGRYALSPLVTIHDPSYDERLSLSPLH